MLQGSVTNPSNAAVQLDQSVLCYRAAWLILTNPSEAAGAAWPILLNGRFCWSRWGLAAGGLLSPSPGPVPEAGTACTSSLRSPVAGATRAGEGAGPSRPCDGGTASGALWRNAAMRNFGEGFVLEPSPSPVLKATSFDVPFLCSWLCRAALPSCHAIKLQVQFRIYMVRATFTTPGFGIYSQFPVRNIFPARKMFPKTQLFR